MIWYGSTVYRLRWVGEVEQTLLRFAVTKQTIFGVCLE